MRKRIPILTGPTAVGKTDLSLALAEEWNAEIVSADSRQIYRRLDIGTAKPAPDILAGTKHHFVDELDLGQPYSAGQFHQDAYRRIEAIQARGKMVVVVGGSTLYIRALKYGLADIPDVPAEVREDIQVQLREDGADALYETLLKVDPQAAQSMDPSKTQRLVRALEVYAATGRPLSSYYAEQSPPPFAFRTFVLHRDRRALYDRINDRVDGMLERGLMDEVRSIMDSGFDPSINPLRTIGYKEPIRHLRGEIPHEEMVQLIKRNTRRYAKRQLTWFRRDPDNTWVDAGSPLTNLIARITST